MVGCGVFFQPLSIGDAVLQRMVFVGGKECRLHGLDGFPDGLWPFFVLLLDLEQLSLQSLSGLSVGIGDLGKNQHEQGYGEEQPMDKGCLLPFFRREHIMAVVVCSPTLQILGDDVAYLILPLLGIGISLMLCIECPIALDDNGGVVDNCQWLGVVGLLIEFFATTFVYQCDAAFCTWLYDHCGCGTNQLTFHQGAVAIIDMQPGHPVLGKRVCFAYGIFYLRESPSALQGEWPPVAVGASQQQQACCQSQK